MISKPLAERKRDAIFYSDRKFCEREIASTNMSRISYVPTAKTPLLEEAENHESILQEVCVPDDDNIDGPYNFQVVPPTPDNPEISMSEKQDAPREREQFLRWEDDEIAQYFGACHLDEAKDQAMLLVVEAGAGSGILHDPPPYTLLQYGQH